ncbi:hypothetical protein DASC09_047310 [Saccharomycopsis crataegensis]|uniref:Uncharacterized protein n=1 Tax=Saccharomycopsis crataegensis TaxID=43959 RepID=A0AAV5QRP3_9ASCO|nr:hypothetical protein DASC09_047310 [Saccharomycopsis crataegensis]
MATIINLEVLNTKQLQNTQNFNHKNENKFESQPDYHSKEKLKGTNTLFCLQPRGRSPAEPLCESLATTSPLPINEKCCESLKESHSGSGRRSTYVWHSLPPSSLHKSNKWIPSSEDAFSLANIDDGNDCYYEDEEEHFEFPKEATVSATSGCSSSIVTEKDDSPSSLAAGIRSNDTKNIPKIFLTKEPLYGK